MSYPLLCPSQNTRAKVLCLLKNVPETQSSEARQPGRYAANTKPVFAVTAHLSPPCWQRPLIRLLWRPLLSWRDRGFVHLRSTLLFRPASAEPAAEAELGEEAVDELILKVISAEEKAQILNMNWKERLAGVQAASQVATHPSLFHVTWFVVFNERSRGSNINLRPFAVYLRNACFLLIILFASPAMAVHVIYVEM